MIKILQSLLVVVVFIAVLVVDEEGFIVNAQKCVDYEDVMSDGTVGFCAGLIAYKYTLPSGATQETLERQAFDAVAPDLDSLKALAIVPATCTSLIKQVTCSAVFQKCQEVDPFDIKLCLGTCTANGTTSSLCDGVVSACTVQAKRVPGRGNLSWSQLAAAQSVTVAQVCAAQGLKVGPSNDFCLVGVPQSPPKSECDKLHEISTTSDCKSVPGLFFRPLLALSGRVANALPGTSPVADVDLRNTMIAELASKSCDVGNANDPTCNGKFFLVNLFSLLGRLPDCSKKVTVSGIEVFLFSPNGNGGTLVRTSNGQSLIPSIPATNPPAGASEFPRKPVMQPSLAFADQLRSTSQARDGTTATVNLEFCDAAIRDSRNLDTPNLGFLTGNATLEQSLFFVSAALGLPPLPHKFNPNLNVLAPSPFEKFMQQPSAKPLCVSRAGESDNSLECLLNAVNSALAAAPTTINPKCRFALLDLVCQSAFLKPQIKKMCFKPDFANGTSSCNKDESFNFALPRFPSRDFCEAVSTECESFVDFLERSNNAAGPALKKLLDCSGKISITCDANPKFRSTVWPEDRGCNSPFNGLDAYPAGNKAVIADLAKLGGTLLPAYLGGLAAQGQKISSFADITSSNVVAQTFSLDKSESQLLASCQCPSPLLVPESLPDPNSATGFLCCQDVCTTSMFKRETFQFYYDFQLALSVPSAIFAGFTFITWLTFKVKRKQRLTLYFSLSSFMLGLSFLITHSAGPIYDDLWCKDATTGNSQEDNGLCSFQAFSIGFFAVAACGWWWCQSLDLFLRIFLNRRNFDLIYSYHLIAWGIPTLAAIIFGSTGAYGYDGPNPWCFIAIGDESVIEFVLFYGPIVFYTSTGFLMMCAVIYRIFKVTTAGQKATKNKASTMKRLAAFRTPVLFVFFFLFVWIIVFGWRFQIVAQEKELRDAATVWVGCLLGNFQANILDPANDPNADVSSLDAAGLVAQNGEGCGSTFPKTINLNMQTLVHIVALLQGVFVFLIFGAHPEVYWLWAERCKLTKRHFDTTADDSKSTTKNKKTGNKGKNAPPSSVTSGNRVQGGYNRNFGSNNDDLAVKQSAFSTNDEQPVVKNFEAEQESWLGKAKTFYSNRVSMGFMGLTGNRQSKPSTTEDSTTQENQREAQGSFLGVPIGSNPTPKPAMNYSVDFSKNKKKEYALQNSAPSFENPVSSKPPANFDYDVDFSSKSKSPTVASSKPPANFDYDVDFSSKSKSPTAAASIKQTPPFNYDVDFSSSSNRPAPPNFNQTRPNEYDEEEEEDSDDEYAYKPKPTTFDDKKAKKMMGFDDPEPVRQPPPPKKGMLDGLKKIVSNVNATAHQKLKETLPVSPKSATSPKSPLNFGGKRPTSPTPSYNTKDSTSMSQIKKSPFDQEEQDSVPDMPSKFVVPQFGIALPGSAAGATASVVRAPPKSVSRPANDVTFRPPEKIQVKQPAYIGEMSFKLKNVHSQDPDAPSSAEILGGPTSPVQASQTRKPSAKPRPANLPDI